jgi:protein-disulfide isomerase
VDVKILVLTFLLLFARPALAQLASVNGEWISEEEVLKAAARELDDLEIRRTQFESQFERDKQAVLESALDRIIRDRVLAAEAAKRGVSVQQLLALEAEAFVARLKKDYAVKSYVEPARTLIETRGRPSKGAADAPVTIVEFADFQCPFCGALVRTLQQIQTAYKGKVRIVYLQFPLVNVHPDAQKAAEASLCAHEQNKFWELHDAMFADQTKISVRDLKHKAAQLSLDTEAFNSCLDSGKYLREIGADVAEAVKAGVDGTPAMFINGRFLGGNLPFADIQKVIEDELQRGL